MTDTDQSPRDTHSDFLWPRVNKGTKETLLGAKIKDRNFTKKVIEKKHFTKKQKAEAKCELGMVSHTITSRTLKAEADRSP